MNRGNLDCVSQCNVPETQNTFLKSANQYYLKLKTPKLLSWNIFMETYLNKKKQLKYLHKLTWLEIHWKKASYLEEFLPGPLLIPNLYVLLWIVKIKIKRCHVSHVTCHMSKGIFFCFFQNIGASWWMVCYQRGLPCLVFGISSVTPLVSYQWRCLTKKIMA